ncbi:MAG: hypothetical protein LAT84_08335 [Balneolia bacterium]|nr:hypothetical protein [Balneolia bacterium]
MKNLILLLAALNIFAMSAPQSVFSQYDDWSYSIIPNINLPLSIQSDITAIGITETITTSTGDLLDFDKAFTFSMRVEARRNNSGFYTEYSFVFAEDTRSVQNYPLPPTLAALINSRFNLPVTVPPGTPATASINAFGSSSALDVGVFSRIVDSGAGNSGFVRYYFEPYAALRFSTIYSRIRFNLDLADIPVLDLSPSTLDSHHKLVFGFGTGFFATDSWSADLKTDFATGLLGPSRKYAYRIMPGLSYQLSEILTLSAGYQFRYLEYEQDQFGLVQEQHALHIGARFILD